MKKQQNNEDNGNLLFSQDETLGMQSQEENPSPSSVISSKEEGKRLTPIKAIRAKCLDCCCGQYSEVRLCTVIGCPLHLYRMGHRPRTIQE